MARGTEPGKPSGAIKNARNEPGSGELDQRLNRLEAELAKKVCSSSRLPRMSDRRLQVRSRRP